ncbi:MAG TPA: serine/threonine-protein kinase [Thermoanaerobaculia bacterium]|nr:serine/threonine-protein kinase [Thermoanaerobaculia bacterium]
MRLKDAALDRLRDAVRTPDLSGTRYRLVGPIGRGGMGAVFEVEDEVLKRRLAVKVVEVPFDGESPAEALLSEARVLARLEHPGLVPVHDAGRLPDGRAFYAMKLVQGERLDAALARLTTLPERLRLFLRVCEPVAFAHANGVIHRDLKPSNVMVGPFGEVLVLDWGLARSLEARELGDASGTPGFMAPEQAAAGPVDARADVYGLGALLDAMLRVAPAPPRPKALVAIVARATAAERDERYPDVLALAADVTRLLDGERVEAHAEGPLERAGRLVRRHRVAVGLVAAYLLTRGLFILLRR